VAQLQDLGCLVKDLDTGLVDFPALFRGQEVYLCWKLGEPSIEFWHGVDEGFRGRKAIDSDFRDHSRATAHDARHARDRNQAGGFGRKNARGLLRAAGFQVSRRRVFETNTVFDTPELGLRRAATLLRVRQAGGVATSHTRNAGHRPAQEPEELELKSPMRA